MLFKKKKFYLLVIFPLFIFGSLFAVQNFIFPKISKSIDISQDFPDPSVLFYNNTFHAYSTQSQKLENPAVATPHAEGKNINQYIYVGDATSNLPSWVEEQELPQTPDVHFDGKQFVMYSSFFNDVYERYTISVGTSQTPHGPFVFGDELNIIDDTASYNVFSPSHFADRDGKEYLLYATDLESGTTIELIEIDKESHQTKGESTTLLTESAVINPVNNGESDFINRVESPQLTVAPNGTYVLFFSGNAADKSTYFTGYAISETIEGPYKYQAALLTTDILENKVVGPGSLSLVSGDDNQNQLVFHGWIGEPGFHTNSIRAMYTAKLNWENGHIPKITNLQKAEISSYQTVEPVLERKLYTTSLVIVSLLWFIIVGIIATSKTWKPRVERLFEGKSNTKIWKEESHQAIEEKKFENLEGSFVDPEEKSRSLEEFLNSSEGNVLNFLEISFNSERHSSNFQKSLVVSEKKSESLRELSSNTTATEGNFSDFLEFAIPMERYSSNVQESFVISEEGSLSFQESFSLSEEESLTVQDSFIVSERLASDYEKSLNISEEESVSFNQFLNEVESESEEKRMERYSVQKEGSLYLEAGLEFFNHTINRIMTHLQGNSGELSEQQSDVESKED